MSYTPRTDKACGWPWGHHGRIESSDLKWSPDGPFVHSSVARELERENAALREDIKTLCEIIDHANPSAWENGNTHPDGYGPDEGTVMMEQLYGPLWHKYMQPVIAARNEVQS